LLVLEINMLDGRTVKSLWMVLTNERRISSDGFPPKLCGHNTIGLQAVGQSGGKGSFARFHLLQDVVQEFKQDRFDRIAFSCHTR